MNWGTLIVNTIIRLFWFWKLISLINPKYFTIEYIVGLTHYFMITCWFIPQNEHEFTKNKVIVNVLIVRNRKVESNNKKIKLWFFFKEKRAVKTKNTTEKKETFVQNEKHYSNLYFCDNNRNKLPFQIQISGVFKIYDRI